MSHQPSSSLSTGADTVVAMADFRTKSRFPELAQVEAYWHGLRGLRALPARVDIDPRGIEGALEYAFVLERVAPGIARMRIAGSHLGLLLGVEARGMPLSAFFAPSERNQLAQAMEAVLNTPAIVTLTLDAETSMGRPAMAARMLLLPLTSEHGEVDRVLGCLVSDGQIGRAPRRFTIQNEKRIEIEAPGAHQDAKTPVYGFGEAAPTFKPNSAAPYLRVVNPISEA